MTDDSKRELRYGSVSWHSISCLCLDCRWADTVIMLHPMLREVYIKITDAKLRQEIMDHQ